MKNRVQGNLLSTTEVNPIEQCKAITLRTGSKCDGPSIEEKGETVEQEKEKGETEKKVTDDLPKKEAVEREDPMPKISYPQRFQKANLDKRFSKFLELFKRLYINIPFVEALTQMPSYGKFMK